MRTDRFTHNLRDMKRFTSFAAFLATLLFSMTFVMQSSAAVVVAGNPVVANPVVMMVAPPAVVMTLAPPVVAKSDAAFVRPGVRAFGFNPFFRPAFNPFFRPAFNPFFRPAFNPFFDVDVDVNPFFGEVD